MKNSGLSTHCIGAKLDFDVDERYEDIARDDTAYPNPDMALIFNRIRQPVMKGLNKTQTRAIFISFRVESYYV